MSHVLKLTKKRSDGTTYVRWRARWKAPDGANQVKLFDKKGDAEAHLAAIAKEPIGSTTITIVELAKAHGEWFSGLIKTGIREAGTQDNYASVLRHHVEADKLFAKTRLCDLSTPKCQGFLDDVFARTGSQNLTKVVRRTLVTWCKYGQRRGWLVVNPAQPCNVITSQRTEGDEGRCEIPPKEQLIELLLRAADFPRDNAMVNLLMFGGLRSSELLGLGDKHVGAAIEVRQRLERRYDVIGPVKSKAGRRDVPIGKGAQVAVRAWRLARGKADLMFPGLNYDRFINEAWVPLMRRAGLVTMAPDSKGKNRPVPAFSPHTLRHVAASLWIEMGLQPKKVQELMGHATLQLTMDLYGHLWSDKAGDEAIAQGAEALIRVNVK